MSVKGWRYGMQLPVQTLTHTLADPWEDTATVFDRYDHKRLRQRVTILLECATISLFRIMIMPLI